MADEEWVARLAALYGEPLGSFTPARDALAKELKAAGDPDAAARAKALRKPALAAWVVNLLVRRDAEQLDQVLTLGESLRAAAADLDGEELRTLTRQRRQLTAAVTTRARGLAREAGVKVTAAVADQVEGTLHAAMLSDAASGAVRTGALVRAVAPSEVGDLAGPEGTDDLDDSVADPALLGIRAPALETPEPGRPDLRVVVDDGAARREAEEALEEAREAFTAAETEATEAADAVATLRARTLQVEEEIDELRRRIATLDATLEEVTDELEEAEDGAEDATLVRDEAAAVLRVAEKALARLDP
ncbi:MAG: hypothetical protein Q8Q02_10390 [Nocardioides sp.]|nr:hypothetical protein [Nocardioides sp.]